MRFSQHRVKDRELKCHFFLAWSLLCFLLVFAFLHLSCIIPPPPLEDDDGFENHAPVFQLKQFSSPVVGKLNIVQRSTDVDNPKTFTITGQIYEIDKNDILEVRAFANENYAAKINIDPATILGPGFADGTRPVSLRIYGLCDTIFQTLGQHTLELYVSDRGFLNNEGREFADEALGDHIVWRIECTEPLPE